VLIKLVNLSRAARTDEVMPLGVVRANKIERWIRGLVNHHTRRHHFPYRPPLAWWPAGLLGARASFASPSASISKKRGFVMDFPLTQIFGGS
jgi:hypothetical protein